MQQVIPHIYLLPLFISMLLSLKSWSSRWPAPYKLFSTLLICVLLVECFAILWPYYHKLFGRNYSPHNLWVYNIFLIPQYLMYFAIYYQVIRYPRIKRAIIVISILYTLFALINTLFFQSVHSIQSYTLLVSYFIVVVLTIIYFEQVRKEPQIIRLRSHPMVWISLGALIFHAGDLPFMVSLNYLNSDDLALATALFYIHLILNCIMYTVYTIAFLCHPPPQK